MSICFSSLLLILFFGNGNALETPYFEWSTESRSSESIPDLLVRFSDGSKDAIELMTYNPIPLNPESQTTNFLGKLRGDSNSVVAVTMENDEYDVTILRATHNDISVHVDKNGESYPVTKVGFSHKHQLDKQTMLPTLETLKEKRPNIGNRAMLRDNYIRMVAGYTDSIIKRVGSVRGFEDWFSKFMTHFQAFYHHPSLGFKITFDTPVPMIDLRGHTSITQAGEDALASLRPLTLSILEKMGNGQHLSVYVADNSQDSLIGMAYMNGICSNTDLAVSITEHDYDVLITAKTAVHELAHNFGVDHDEDPCNGIMYWKVNGGNTWTTCSKKEFYEYYQSIVKEKGYWCLDRENPSNYGGSWESWSPYSLCNKPCNRGTNKRTRKCIGFNCPGLSEQTSSCNTQACPICKDTINDCLEKKEGYWCGSMATFMKQNCPQACNTDKDDSLTCADYKQRGFCEPSHVNFVYALQQCGLTCGYFCN